jgi:hypothetical protein
VLTFRFAEQDITGDVLLELDLGLLKSEIGVTAFGKRKRIANAIEDLRKLLPTPAPGPTVQPESLFSHSRSIGSAQGSSLNSLSLSSPAPLISATGSQTPGGFYQSDSPRITEDTFSLSPDTPRSTGPRRESDPGSIQENAEPPSNRASSRNSIIGLGIQLSNKFQVSAVWGKVGGKILMPIGFHRKADQPS